MAISISIGITQNSQNIANNTSNVTVKVTAKWTYGSYNKNSKSGWLKIDGTQYSFTSSFNTGQSTSGSQVLFEKTVNITHAADGKKTLSCSASYTSGVSSGTVTASASKTLTTIPRASSLTVGNGTLGTELTLTINRAATTLTHTITYKCGTASGTVGTGLGTSAKWNTGNGNTVNLSSQNTTGTTVSVTFTLTTYSGSTAIGTSTKSITMSIPSSVMPSISAITPSEASGIVPSDYGYVKDHSKLKIVTTTAGAQGSTIKSIAVVFDGVTYSGSNVTTNVLRYSGTRTISVTVTDSRGRKATKTSSVTVQDYSEPVINSFTVVRCNADGYLNEQGEYMLISFNASITALNNKNVKNFIVRYKKSSETNYTSVPISATNYSVSGSLDPIPANSGSSYNVSFDVADTFATVTKNLMLSTAFTILNFKADGTGVGAGKVSEEADLWDFGFKVRLNGGVLQPVLPDDTNFDDVKTPNTYTLNDVANSRYINCPFSSGSGTLKVEACGGNGQLHQTATFCHKNYPTTFERYYYTDSWGAWLSVDNVVEQGTVSGWNYRKWSSGVIEAWHTPTISVATNTAYGSGYYNGSVLKIDFPSGMFKNKPLLSVIAHPANAQLYSVNVADITANDMSYYISSMNSNTATSVLLMISAYGFWDRG